jgi:hypothetical protein
MEVVRTPTNQARLAGQSEEACRGVTLKCKELRDVTSQTPQPLHQKGAMISSAYHAAGGIYTR